MKILLTNDDGVFAPGINYLKKVLDPLAEVLIVAPDDDRSTTGHTLTLTKPLRLKELHPNIYACSGHPADCVFMALGGALGSWKPDLVISGVNRGANLGQDVFYSGTVAAAREATFHGIPSLAVSLVIDFNVVLPNPLDEAPYHASAMLVKTLVRRNIHESIPSMHFCNINVPQEWGENLSFPVDLTCLGHRYYSGEVELRTDPRQRPYHWIVGKVRGYAPIPNSDCLSIDKGRASISLISHWPRVEEHHLRLQGLIQELTF